MKRWQVGETIEERTEMKKLLVDVEKGLWDGVLVMEIQRLARGDTEDQGIVAKVFKYSSTKIITTTKIYDPTNVFDEEFFEYSLFMSRFEYKAINRRLQMGRLTSVKEGKFVAGTPPFGYKKKKLENDKGYTLEIYEDEAKVVRKIFELYSYQDESINSVVRTINRLEFKPRKAQHWTISAVKDLLNNPAYIGMIRWNWRKEVVTTKDGKKQRSRPRNDPDKVLLVKGKHEAIIDTETWLIAQEKRRMNQPKVIHSKELKNPLAGIVFCEKCGKKMQMRPYTSKDKIPTLMCTTESCNNISSKLYIVEEKIIGALKYWLQGYKMEYKKISFNKQNKLISDSKENKALLQINLQKEREKLRKIFDYFEDGTYSKEEFKERSIVLKEKIEGIEKEILFVENNILENEKDLNNRYDIIPRVKNVLDVYYKVESAEEKNELLKTILSKVTYLKTEKAIKKDSDPTNFELNLFPKISKQ